MRLVIALTALIPALGQSVEVDIGGTRINIPTPAGYTQVTNKMQPYADFAKRLVPSTNVEVASFILNADVPSVSKGGLATSGKRAYVQVVKSVQDQFVTKADFEDLKRSVQRENDEIIRKVEKEIPGMMDKVSKGLAKDYNANLSLNLNSIVPFPPHEDTNRTFSYSLLINMSASGGTASKTNTEGVVTATFVHVRGKLLNLYLTGDKSELQTNRTAASAWATHLLATNPSTGEIASKEDKKFGFDWNRILVAAGIGGVVGAIAHLFKKKEKRGWR